MASNPKIKPKTAINDATGIKPLITPRYWPMFENALSIAAGKLASGNINNGAVSALNNVIKTIAMPNVSILNNF